MRVIGVSYSIASSFILHDVGEFVWATEFDTIYLNAREKRKQQLPTDAPTSLCFDSKYLRL